MSGKEIKVLTVYRTIDTKYYEASVQIQVAAHNSDFWGKLDLISKKEAFIYYFTAE
jgi:hypothetical protein